FAKPDLYRQTLFRVWRRMAESMPWDDFSDHVTTQAVGARFMESPDGEAIFELVRSIVALNDPYTVRQACLAMEQMDLSPLVPQIRRPLLMTNETHDILCPPDLAPSGLGARRMAELNEQSGRRCRREPVALRDPAPADHLHGRRDPRGTGGHARALRVPKEGPARISVPARSSRRSGS